MAEGLRAQGWMVQRSTGYPGEHTGTDFSVPTDVPDQGEKIVTYWYRDSNTSIAGDNNNSSQVNVKMKLQWNITKGSNNSFHIVVESYLLSIVRNDVRGNVTANPGRRIWVYGVGGALKWGPTDTNPAANGSPNYNGNLYLGKIEYDLKPQQNTSSSQLSMEYVNWTIGYGNPSDSNSPFVDHFMCGIQFLNTLPDECDPPSLASITQVDDICENEVEACLRFAPCSCEGMGLVFEWHYEGESWSDAAEKGYARQEDASHTAANIICLQHLPPTNHTWSPMVLYWRAKYVPVTAEMPETDWVEGSFQTLFILHPHETVPDISVEECSKLKRGELIGKYEEETCYNEFSCADMKVTNTSRDADVEECKKVNGVA